MMRFRLKNLSGQLIAVMLVAAALSQIVSWFIYRYERVNAMRGVLKEECVGRATSAMRLAQATPPGERAEVLDKIGTLLTRYWLTDHPPESPLEWQARARVALMRQPYFMRNSSAPNTVFSRDSTLDRTSGVEWVSMSAGESVLHQPANLLDLKRWNGFGLAIQLDDGTWLNTVFAKPNYLMSDSMTPGYYATLAFTVLLFVLAAWLVARRISRPLRHLAQAAERLGRGEEAPVLPEDGPDDVRATLAAFNRMQIRIRRFIEDRTRMLAAIGHDLRTPITSMRLRSEFVSDHETRDKLVATLDEMQAMTEAALAFARSEATSEAGRVVDLAALTESLCDDLAELGCDVTFENRSGRLPYHCRPDALRRALRNVIENAVRYGERARVFLNPLADRVTIQVEDDGPGIEESEHERVFEPFVRLEASRNPTTGGVGLGLAIARSIVRGHGGDIHLANTGSGLVVQIHLPAICSTQTSGKSPAR